MSSRALAMRAMVESTPATAREWRALLSGGGGRVTITKIVVCGSVRSYSHALHRAVGRLQETQARAMQESGHDKQFHGAQDEDAPNPTLCP